MRTSLTVFMERNWVRSNDQEQSAVGSVECIRQAVEKRGELHEETHREAPADG